MRKCVIYFMVALSMLTILYSCQTKLHTAFVKVTGTHFTFNDTPYYFVGTNFWYGAYLGADTAYGNRARLTRELDRLQKLNVRNLRVVAASKESAVATPLTPPFQYKDGHYNEKLLEGLDFLLSEMDKRGMHAVMVLNNFWSWSGGMSEYVAWAKDTSVVDPTANKNLTWDDFANFSAQFYHLPEAQKKFQKYIAMLIGRKNSITNTMYRNDPAIMTWELANEPRPAKPGNPDENINLFSKWIDQTASYIHSLDTNHLVTTGSEGSISTSRNLDYIRQAHAGKFIDYMTIHIWPKNWGWYKPEQPSTLDSSEQKTIKYLDDNLTVARELQKPMVVEEFGFMRDNERNSPDSPVVARNSYYQFIFQLIEDSIKAGSPLAGCNFWGWGGEGRAQHSDFQWQNGDTSYVGDPYAEPQGVNSVYDTDEGTLKIISRYTKNLDKLSGKKENDK